MRKKKLTAEQRSRLADEIREVRQELAKLIERLQKLQSAS
jgi:ubiquinone biosynthesis protein UbiJ